MQRVSFRQLVATDLLKIKKRSHQERNVECFCGVCLAIHTLTGLSLVFSFCSFYRQISRVSGFINRKNFSGTRQKWERTCGVST